MKKRLFTITFLFLLVCRSNAQQPLEIPKPWKPLNGCGVTIYVPPDVDFVEDSSVDTCERYYKGKSTSIHITVTEWNIGQSDYSNWPDHCVTKLQINRRDAEIVTSYIPLTSEADKGRDFSAMLLAPKFRPAGGNLRIRTWSKTLQARNEALKILRSLKFE